MINHVVTENKSDKDRYLYRFPFCSRYNFIFHHIIQKVYSFARCCLNHVFIYIMRLREDGKSYVSILECTARKGLKQLAFSQLKKTCNRSTTMMYVNFGLNIFFSYNSAYFSSDCLHNKNKSYATTERGVLEKRSVDEIALTCHHIHYDVFTSV